MSGGIDFSNVAAPFPYHDLIPSALREPAGVELIPGTVSHLGLIYRSVLGYRPLRLDLHRPQDADGPVPIVVYVHGGSFIGGVPEMGPWTSLPASGIAVAAISYRLAGEAAFPGPVDDIRAGLSWLHRNSRRWGLDRERFGLWGSSAGGFIAAIVALHPLAGPRVDAVVLHYPLTSPRNLLDDALPDGRENARRLESITELFCPDMPSVSDFIESGEAVPSFSIVHGTGDNRVGHSQSQRLHSALVKSGKRSTLDLIPGADHGSSKFNSLDVADEAISHFRKEWGRCIGSGVSVFPRHHIDLEEYG